MGKIRKNEAGFSAIEVVLVLVVVTLIGVVGFMVFKSHNKKTTTSTVATTSTKKPTTTTQTKTTTQAPTDPYSGWKTFTANVGNLSLKYPADWTLTDRTANSNEDQAFTLTSTSKDYGQFELDFDLLSQSQEKQPPQYPVDANVQTLTNALKVWTDKMQWTSKHYNNFQPFDCARLHLLDKTANTDVTLASSEYLSSQGGFCFGQDTYTTKSYQDQLSSQEYKDAVNIFSSIKY